MYIRIRGYGLPSFIFWVLNSPLILGRWFMCLIRQTSISKMMGTYRVINELRKTCLYYAEKDNQSRGTVRCHYKRKRYVLNVRLRFNKKAKKALYEDFRETLETHTCNVSNITYKKGYAYFDVILDKEPLYEYASDNVSVSIGTGFDGIFRWHWTTYPHLLLVGETGQGKSVFVRYVLNGLFDSNHEVWCIDGKVIDYTRFKGSFKAYEPNNANSKIKVIALVSRFRAYMYKRLEDMKNLGIYDYFECEHFKPKFLLIDEYITIVEGMSKEERKEFEKTVSDIVLLGRATGYIILITMQRGDAKYISGALRDNFMCRVVVGSASDTSYRMMFDEAMTGFDKGQAWCMLGNELNVISIPFYQDIISNRQVLEDKERNRANEEDKSEQ